MLRKAMRILADSGVSEDALANDTGMAAEIVYEILRAADGARPQVEVTPFGASKAGGRGLLLN
jgi:hypothetical protein